MQQIQTETAFIMTEEEEIPEAVPPIHYVRYIPPSQDCEAEKMVTIEPISLRRGGWRNSGTVLSDLRHVDPKLGIIIFYAVIAALLFFLYWKRFQSLAAASLYTTSSVTMFAVALHAAFGIDFFTAVGAAFVPH